MYEEESSRMIRWLAGRSPDAWHSAALHLNWDFAEDIIHWIVEQPQCDKATAALLLWLLNPDEYVDEHPFEGRSPKHFDLFVKIVSRWKAGDYISGGLKWHEDTVACGQLYRGSVAAREDGIDPFDLPEELFAAHDGREVADELRPEHNSELRELLRGLGTHVTSMSS